MSTMVVPPPGANVLFGRSLPERIMQAQLRREANCPCCELADCCDFKPAAKRTGCTCGECSHCGEDNVLASARAEYTHQPIFDVRLAVPQHHETVWVRSSFDNMVLVVPPHTSFRGAGDKLYCSGEQQEQYSFRFFHVCATVCARYSEALCLLENDGMNDAAILAISLFDRVRQTLEQRELPNAALWFANASTQLNALLGLTKE